MSLRLILFCVRFVSFVISLFIVSSSKQFLINNENKQNTKIIIIYNTNNCYFSCKESFKTISSSSSSRFCLSLLSSSCLACSLLNAKANSKSSSTKAVGTTLYGAKGDEELLAGGRGQEMGGDTKD